MGYDSESDGASNDVQPSRPIVIGGHDLRPRQVHDDTRSLEGSDHTCSPRDITDAEDEDLPAHVDLWPREVCGSPLEIPLPTDCEAATDSSLELILLSYFDFEEVPPKAESPIAPTRLVPRGIASAYTRPPPIFGDAADTHDEPADTHDEPVNSIVPMEPARKPNSTDFSCLHMDAPSYPMWDRSSIDHWKGYFVPYEVQQRIHRGACGRAWEVGSLCTGTWSHGSVFWVSRGVINELGYIVPNHVS
jgi:hypothetical protein